MREVENDPVKSLWQISHMLLLASYLCIWQSSQLSNLAQHCETRKQYRSKGKYCHEQHAYKDNVLATYNNSKNRKTAGIPFAKKDIDCLCLPVNSWQAASHPLHSKALRHIPATLE